MADAYRGAGARLYRRLFAGYADRAGPRVLAAFQARAGGAPRRALDLGCGTGEMADFLARHGFAVTGVDRSADMLFLARELCGDRVTLVRGDLTRPDVEPGTFGLVVSLSHTLNHLPGPAALRRCFHAAAAATAPGGLFAFDLVTRRGLDRWNAITIDEREDYTLIRRGVYNDRERRGQTRMTGFLRAAGDLFERFDEVLTYRAFDLHRVEKALNQAGWTDVIFTARNDLETPLEDPEAQPDVVALARRQ